MNSSKDNRSDQENFQMETHTHVEWEWEKQKKIWTNKQQNNVDNAVDFQCSNEWSLRGEKK